MTKKRIPSPAGHRRCCEQLVLSLAAYVSDDDVGLPRTEFLLYVRDRIDDDIKALKGDSK
jgi:hypothetical protein